jgi:hypothetical protein
MQRTYYGSPRVCLATAVEECKAEIMRRDCSLTALEAHRLAIDSVVKQNPEILKRYRLDCQAA